VSLNAARILVVEDNDTLRRGIALALRDHWTEVTEVADGDAAIEKIQQGESDSFDVILTDLRLPGSDGVSVLRAAQERDPSTSVLVMTAYGSIETAVGAMRSGAYDFVEKPLDLDQLEMRVARGVDHRRLVSEVTELRAEQAARNAADQMVGSSPALKAAEDLARRVAPTRSTVLVVGETGTGKELIAALVHQASPRANGPLVKVNCAALPETLLESELFGHERGAFTGADRRRVGRFEEASGGTLFLDEIGDTSLATQAKLLRVLQEQRFHRLGGSTLLHTDARIVSATNQDLGDLIGKGLFREDLFFRLNVIRIDLPPLRERGDDLLDLAYHFLSEFRPHMRHPIRGFTEAALERIRSHGWPGNIRELRNAIERSVLMAEGSRIRAEDLSIVNHAAGASGRVWKQEFPAGGISLREVERELVENALKQAGYVQKDAASLLSVSRRKLNYMIQRMGITHPSWRRNRDPEHASGRPEKRRPLGSDTP
jgi:DNA-binding NtrC family response regulator